MKKGFLNGSPFGSVEKAKTGAKKVDKEAAEKAAWPWPKDDPNEWSGSGLTKAEKDEMRAERRRVREFVMKVPLQVWHRMTMDMLRMNMGSGKSECDTKSFALVIHSIKHVVSWGTFQWDIGCCAYSTKHLICSRFAATLEFLHVQRIFDATEFHVVNDTYTSVEQDIYSTYGYMIDLSYWWPCSWPKFLA